MHLYSNLLFHTFIRHKNDNEKYIISYRTKIKINTREFGAKAYSPLSSRGKLLLGPDLAENSIWLLLFDEVYLLFF